MPRQTRHEQRRLPRGRGSWRVLLGLAWLVPSLWVWVTRAGVAVAGHPAYPLLVGVASIVGAVLVVFGVRDLAGHGQVRPRPARRRRWVVVGGRALAATLCLTIVGSIVYLRPFGATDDALRSVKGTDAVSVTTTPTRITLTPRAAAGTSRPTIQSGLIFQPGARVDPRAYVRLLSPISAAGVLVVIVKQPMGIGFTATGAPSGIIEDHPDVAHWSVGGHSLGGVAASSYVEDHPDQVDGLLLWASYPLGSLAGLDHVAVTSIYGTEDGLATPEDIKDSRADLPPDTTYVDVTGGVHAFFGDYGEQPGDGTPTVSREQAQTEIVEASVALVTAAAR